MAAAADAPEEAREHWRSALETLDENGISPETLTTLKELVEICRAGGNDERARDAPDPTTAQHRDWLERHAAELVGE